VALARGRFGIEYNPKQLEPESSGLGWLIALVALVALVSFGWTLAKRFRLQDPQIEAQLEELPALEIPEPDVQPVPPTSQTFKTFQPLNADLANRPARLRNLLMRLEEAEKRCDVELAVNTIETIRSLPGSPAADIDDSLARRLGALNIRRLFDLRNGQWVKSVVVKRGDSASRIAAENGSTLASFARLNGNAKVERLVKGKKVLVMDHPRFNLVLRRRTRIADLSLNGKFFKRYDLEGDVKARAGTYEMPDKRRLFWNGVGSPIKAADRAEIDLLLPVGATVLVSEL